jgi:hypothetical protein
MSEYREFHGPSGELGPLLDHVQQVKRRDFADDEVRAAFAEHSEKSRVDEMADKYGHDGVNQMLHWNAEIKHSGPNVAQKAGLYYATQPRPAPEPEDEPRNEDDHMAAVRAAFRQESKKQTPEQKAAAVDGIRKLSDEHGNLGIIDKFGNWHQQLSINPYDAAPRIANEIAGHVNESVAMQSAHAQLSDYQKAHRITNAERVVMQRALLDGSAVDLKSAHALAKEELAVGDVDDLTADIVRSVRQLKARR